MPDWSYRTVLQPVLFALPPRAARDLSLSVMGLLGATWAGRTLIDLLGHMRAPDGVAVTIAGLRFPSRMGLACHLDPALRATSALARFGCGFIEVGPIRAGGRTGRVARDDDARALILDDPAEGCGLATAMPRLVRSQTAGTIVLVRVDARESPDAGQASETMQAIVTALGGSPRIHGFTVACGQPDWSAGDWRSAIEPLAAKARAAGKPLFVVVPDDLADAERRACLAGSRAADGFVVDGASRTTDGRRSFGTPAREAALAGVGAIRQACGPDVPILAGAGIHTPQDALDTLAAGADLVAIDSGLVFGGPGLPKRVNEAMAAAAVNAQLPTANSQPWEASGARGPRAAESSWLWTLLMGVGMLFGSVMAFAIATTRVVLPYDEHFVGLARPELAAINAHLLPFLTHDRVTLAGAMAAIGVLYTGLSWFGVRRGRHWAQLAILVSAATGFVSFFLFLGFGYFDPFHAFVTAILFQLMVMGCHGRLGPERELPPPMRVEDRAWRLGLWGQLGFVVQGVGFIGAGLIISTIGATGVFVREDLEFLGTTADVLLAAKPNLVPLVAHDRATLGGMLLASGLVILLTALWGFRPGERWLWWTLALAGLPGYAAAIGIHYVVGYHSALHLAPAFVGLALFIAALGASHASLTSTPNSQVPTPK